jgi:hypothetical protein
MCSYGENMSNSTKPPVTYSLDDYFQSMPIGSIDKALTNNLYGINHRQIPNSLLSNKDVYGLTFFVRPQLNLDENNVKNERLLYSLLTSTSTSIQRFVRTTLDPRLVHGKPGTSPLPCPIMDNTQAFIPVLSNNITNISGWPDMALPTFTSKPGIYEEAYSQADGVVTNYTSFDMDATFRNTRGDPILYMFYIWVHYQSFVFQGILQPYPDFIISNTLDYTTRIYRLVLDVNRKYVKKIAAVGAAFPISVPIGQFFDYTTDKPYNDQSKDITIRFRCMGVIALDDILIFEFNATVVIFNPMMGDRYREANMVKISYDLLQQFNNRGYARIEPKTYELEWWVPKDLHAAKTGAFLKANLNWADQTVIGE